MHVETLVSEIDAALHRRGTADRAIHEKAYLKSALEHYGVTVPAIRQVAKAAWRAHPELDHRTLTALVDELWAAPVHERRMVAVELLDLGSSLLDVGDLALIERLLREARTWALVDGLAASVVGALLARDATTNEVLDRWAADDDFWIRRSALLAHLRSLRSGAGDFERFARYADRMLDEQEFFIRKAIGWVLRDTARQRPDLVHEWLLPRAARASGVTVREAIKPLSPQQRAEILAAR